MKSISIILIVDRLHSHIEKVYNKLSDYFLANVNVAKRFREFLNLPSHIDLKAADDTIDIVGFLAFEMVRALTLGGLDVKRSLEELAHQDHSSPTLGKRKATGGIESNVNKRRREESPDRDADWIQSASSLFLPPLEARTPLRPEHIQDAFARMQNDWAHHRSGGMRNWRGGLVRTSVSLI